MEEEIKDPGPYMAQILKVPVKDFIEGRLRLTKIIAEAWDIPEDKILGSTEVINKKHPSPKSSRGERVRTPGERKTAYVNARKMYFYVMVDIKHYSFRALKKITGRKIAAINYYNRKAKEHMNLEREYMNKAQYVLDYINKDLVIFPEILIIFDANATVIERRGPDEDSPTVPLSEDS
jgi:hypothetical protein